MQEVEMRWFIDSFARRRLHDQIMECSKAALPCLLERVPQETAIDATAIAELSIEIGTAMATQFLKRGLI